MGTKLYVGNLSFNTTENELQELFSQAGPVQEVTLMQDKFTGKSRGFAFVTMGSVLLPTMSTMTKHDLFSESAACRAGPWPCAHPRYLSCSILPVTLFG